MSIVVRGPGSPASSTIRSVGSVLMALHVVSLVTHDCATILAQRKAVDGDEVAALLALLTEVPLAG